MEKNQKKILKKFSVFFSVNFFQYSNMKLTQPIKRPCRYIFPHFRYTFSDPHFLVFSNDLELKPHGKPVQLDFWAQKRGFRVFKKNFRKIMVFQAKTKKKILFILFVPKRPKTHCRHNLLLFLPYKPIKTSKQAQTCHFWHF